MPCEAPRIDLRRELPAYRQIEARLKSAIASGELAFGSRLPGVRDLADHYGTSVFTIKTALDSLEAEGLIERTRRLGTFVRGGSTRLTSAGIYFGRDFLHGREMAFFRTLRRRLDENLGQRNIKQRIWVDTRSETEQGVAPGDLAEAVARRQIQGLIIGMANRAEMAWLKSLDIPFAVFGSAPVPTRVAVDGKRMIRDAVLDLKRQGCRSIGAILPTSIADIFQTPVATDLKEILHTFVDTAADHGLGTSDSWIKLPDRAIPAEQYEEFGYQAFQEIWKNPQRPDGLLIYPDIVARGSVTAALHLRVSVPGELKLVLHRNKGIPLLCPLPATWVEFDPGQAASALVRQIECQLAGEPTEPIFIPHTLETPSRQPADHATP